MDLEFKTQLNRKVSSLSPSWFHLAISMTQCDGKGAHVTTDTRSYFVRLLNYFRSGSKYGFILKWKRFRLETRLPLCRAVVLCGLLNP